MRTVESGVYKTSVELGSMSVSKRSWVSLQFQMCQWVELLRYAGAKGELGWFEVNKSTLAGR